MDALSNRCDLTEGAPQEDKEHDRGGTRDAPSVCLARCDVCNCIVRDLLISTVRALPCRETGERGRLARMIWSSTFPQFRHRAGSLPMQDSCSMRS